MPTTGSENSYTMVTMTSEQFEALLNSNRQPAPVTFSTPREWNFTKCSVRFDGTTGITVESFLDNSNTFRKSTGVSDENAVTGLTMLWTGKAANWWQGQNRV